MPTKNVQIEASLADEHLNVGFYVELATRGNVGGREVEVPARVMVRLAVHSVDGRMDRVVQMPVADAGLDEAAVRKMLESLRASAIKTAGYE